MPNNNTLGEVQKLQDAIFASNYGLPRDFIKKNSDTIYKANKAVNDVLIGYGLNNVTSNSNSLQELNYLVSSSIRFKRNLDDYKNMDNGDLDPVTGMKTITPIGNIDSNEREIVENAAQMYQSFLNVTAEYRGVVNIIPEIDRAIKNIVRDVLSVSELSGKVFNKVYDDDDAVGGMNEEAKKATKICNDLILKEIIEKNELEEKFKRWTYESVVCGAKPVAFIPYDYIIRQLNNLNTKEQNLNIDVNKFRQSIASGESFPICESDTQNRKFYETSIESSFSEMIDINKIDGGDVETKAEEAFDKLFDDDICDAYANFCDENAPKGYESIINRIAEVRDSNVRNYQISGSRSTEANEQLELLETTQQTYKTKQEELKKLSKDEKRKLAKKGLKQLARFIDENIDVVKSGASSAFIANKVMRQKDRYSSFYNLGENYYMAEGIKNKFNKDENNKNTSGGSTMDDFDNQSMLGKECLIVPYSPESVVPINVNGEYMGFYCMEYEHSTGPTWKHRKRSGSFTDYVLQQGYGNDSNFLGGNAPMVAYGGADPLENNLYSPLALYNYSVNQYLYGGMDQQDQRFDIMKTVVLRVLAHRLRDPDLADNKVFKDAVMHMLRNDVLVRRKVQFTFIPPEYMCYMTYQVDDDGIPKSILDGTLFFAYMYISSVVSSAMIKMLKSSDKEKYEVDVGLQKNIGYTIDEMQRCLSTRSIYSSNMFGSLSSVIKNAGAYQRLIIPVVNGNKLYDVTQIERLNDISPDDDFTGKMLQSILSKIYVNAGMMSEMDSVDFAKQLSMRNLEYRNNIVDTQHNYEKFYTKSLKILTRYSQLESYNSKSEAFNKSDEIVSKVSSIDISRIHVELSIPTMLSMTNITEMLDSAKNVANSIAEVYNLQDGSEIETARNTLFKRKIIEKYANIVEWSEIEEILESATKEAGNLVNNNKKIAKIDEQLQNDDSVEETSSSGNDIDIGE